MTAFWSVVSFLLLVFFLFLIVRLVVSWVMLFARQWRPTGVIAAGLELVFMTTEPPLRALRKVIPPIRMGNVNLDLGLLILFVVVGILMQVVRDLAG